MQEQEPDTGAPMYGGRYEGTESWNLVEGVALPIKDLLRSLCIELWLGICFSHHSPKMDIMLSFFLIIRNPL